jgi:hypothetical protein
MLEHKRQGAHSSADRPLDFSLYVTDLTVLDFFEVLSITFDAFNPTAASIFQMWLNILSPKITFRLLRKQLTVPTLHRRISGFWSSEELARRADVRRPR